MGPKGKEDGAGLIALVTQVSKAFHRRSTEELLGMRLKEFMVLGYINDHPRVTQQEVGEGMFFDANTVVLLLNELESRGWSIRRRDVEDRRRHVVEITAEGREALARAEKAREAIEDDVFGELTRDERETLRRLLSKALEGQTVRA
ncbi:MAG TPA: MarR family winged helix-turn-helix transcriptional regulator [Candidatus Dormibacteraeota bacterium]